MFNIFEKKSKYRILFLRREYSAIFYVSMKTSNSITQLTKGNNNKHYIIDINSPSYINQRKNLFLYFVDIDSGIQLTFQTVEKQMKPEELDMIVGTKIIKELTAGVIDNFKEKILWVGIGLVIGALVGITIMNFVMNNKIDEIYQNLPILPISPIG